MPRMQNSIRSETSNNSVDRTRVDDKADARKEILAQTAPALDPYELCDHDYEEPEDWFYCGGNYTTETGEVRND